MEKNPREIQHTSAADYKAAPFEKVILPLGSLESHGPHLPFGTDPLNADWMKDALKQNPALIAHKDYDGPALIASTPELQKFALKFAGDEKAFPKGQAWLRKK